MTEKSVYVAFANSSLEKDFESLKNIRFEDKQLYDFIQRSINALKNTPTYGVKIILWSNKKCKLNIIDVLHCLIHSVFYRVLPRRL
jgi:hypothetical protein